MPRPWSYQNPPNWGAIRRRILARDEHVCQACHTRAGVEVDHIIGVTEWVRRGNEGSPHDEGNLRALCQVCHATKTKAESADGRRRAQAAKRARLTRPTEPHPGALPARATRPISPGA